MHILVMTNNNSNTLHYVIVNNNISIKDYIFSRKKILPYINIKVK